jgi:hypothetical protein
MLLIETKGRGIGRLLVRWNGIDHDPVEAEALDVLAKLIDEERTKTFGPRLYSRSH